jgi:hypothetical protein
MTPLIQGSDSGDGRHFAGPFVRIVYFEFEPSCGGKNPNHVRAATRRAGDNQAGAGTRGRRVERGPATVVRMREDER